jgi:hypothetical protein
MDPFEEFEFKPLTDGLGFHKKKNPTPAPILNRQEAPPEKHTSFLQDKGLDLLEDAATDPLRSPLPRKKQNSNTTILQAPLERTSEGSAVDEILKTLQNNRRFEITNEKAKILATPNKEVYKLSYWSFSAALLDGMLVTAASLLCMIILLVITKADLMSNFMRPDADGMIYVATASIFALIASVYLIINRIFVGCTPGEWAFDQTLGKPDAVGTTEYTLRVLVRTFVTVVTGFVTLPLLSLFMQKDLTGQITGVSIYKKS